MATSKPAAKDEAAPAETRAKPSRLKGVLITGVVGVVFLGAGAGASWWFFGRHVPAGAQQTATPAAPEAIVTAAPPSYLAIEPMVVNLSGDSGDRLVQIGITLALSDEKSNDRIKAFLPAIRNAAILTISQRAATDLLTREGKEKLARDIQAEVTRIIGAGATSPVREVLFLSLIHI